MTRLRRALRLSPVDIVLTLLALLLLCAAHVVIRTVPFTRWRRWVGRLCFPPGPAVRRTGRPRAGSRAPAAPRVPPQLISYAVGRAARLVPRSRCLVQALAATALYRLCGHAPRFAIGVRLDPADGLLAHAWVAVDGVVRIGWLPELASFRLLELQQRLPASAIDRRADRRGGRR